VGKRTATDSSRIKARLTRHLAVTLRVTAAKRHSLVQHVSLNMVEAEWEIRLTDEYAGAVKHFTLIQMVNSPTYLFMVHLAMFSITQIT
jgi:hypothetical protein